jgi:multidrug resistance efflux pump
VKQLALATTLAVLGTGVLIVADQSQRPQATPRGIRTANAKAITPIVRTVHAAGRIEGTTESIAIHPEFAGRIETVHVSRGSEVAGGDVLFELDASRYRAHRDLAKARLEAARAEKMRLVAGARESEIEAARHNMLAAEATFQNSVKRLERARRLFKNNAISSQTLEDHVGEHDTHQALLMAARQRFETVRADPRQADLLSVDAKIASAEAELQIAELDLQHCVVRSPCDAVVLDVEFHRGEWVSPQQSTAVVELANTERLRVVADVDERDALLVRVGQLCEVTADAVAGETFVGHVVEIEPRMEPKRIYGGWAGERQDTHTRRVWIDLQSAQDLPLGLPVEVKISTPTEAEDGQA